MSDKDATPEDQILDDLPPEEGDVPEVEVAIVPPDQSDAWGLQIETFLRTTWNPIAAAKMPLWFLEDHECTIIGSGCGPLAEKWAGSAKLTPEVQAAIAIIPVVLPRAMATFFASRRAKEDKTDARTDDGKSEGGE